MKRYYKPFTNLKNLQKSEGFLFLYFFIEHNGLQLGAVCAGLWVGNCAKVLLCISLFFTF